MILEIAQKIHQMKEKPDYIVMTRQCYDRIRHQAMGSKELRLIFEEPYRLCGIEISVIRGQRLTHGGEYAFVKEIRLYLESPDKNSP